LRQGRALNLCSKLKLNLIVRRKDHFRGTEHAIGGNVEFLADFYAENAEEMVRVGTQQKSAVAFHAIGNPAPARHTRLSIT
jgi:hypothetical protein